MFSSAHSEEETQILKVPELKHGSPGMSITCSLWPAQSFWTGRVLDYEGFEFPKDVVFLVAGPSFNVLVWFKLEWRQFKEAVCLRCSCSSVDGFFLQRGSGECSSDRRSQCCVLWTQTRSSELWNPAANVQCPSAKSQWHSWPCNPDLCLLPIVIMLKYPLCIFWIFACRLPDSVK